MPTVETVRGPVELSDRMLVANPVAYFTKAA